ncbi:MAG: cation transporter [Salinisphaeraceae bacterium]|nr:cation transporter [Salinisphaeraceae bacterium]
MADSCGCSVPEEVIDHGPRRRVLQIVLILNLVGFAVEFGVALWAQSSALLADSMDMIGDVMAYAFSLYVVGKSLAWRVRAARLKGWIQFVFGVAVLIEVARHAIYGIEPVSALMLYAATGALVLNLICAGLLMSFRNDDINMKSVWLCSRNDVIGNIGVILAAGLVAISGSIWPDIIVGALIGLLFLRTSFRVLREAGAAQT